MSVVNKMLQDLEQRQATDDALGADYQPPAKRNGIKWLVLLIVFVAALVAWLLLSDSKNSHSNSQTHPYALLKAESERSQTVIKQQRTSSVAASASPIPTPAVTPPVEASSAKVDTPQTPPMPASAHITQPTPSSDLKKEDKKESKRSQAAKQIIIKRTASGPRAEAQQALQQGDTASAIKALQRLIAQEPNNLRARKKLVALVYADGKQEQAERMLGQWIAQWPKRADLRLMQARLYRQQGNNKKALQTLKNLQPDTAAHTEYLVQRATLARDSEDYQQAYQDYLALVSHNAQRAVWWLGLGISAERLKQPNTAIAAYQKALQLRQLSPKVTDFMQQRLRALGARS